MCKLPTGYSHWALESHSLVFPLAVGWSAKEFSHPATCSQCCILRACLGMAERLSP